MALYRQRSRAGFGGPGSGGHTADEDGERDDGMRRWGARRRSSRERGATMVEYALIMSSLVVVSIGAVQFLEDRATSESRNQADCIAERPPRASCQIPAITTTTTVATTPTSATSVPPCTLPCATTSSTTTTTAPPPPPNTADWDQGSTDWTGDVDPPFSQSVSNGNGTWDATAIVGVHSAGGAAAPGATVRVKWTAPDLPFPQYQTCTTGGDGSCSFTITLPDSSDTATAEVVQITSDPPVAGLPGLLAFARP